MPRVPLHIDDQVRARFRDLHQKLVDDLTLANMEMQEETIPRIQAMLSVLHDKEDDA